MSYRGSTSGKHLKHIKFFLDCTHQFCVMVCDDSKKTTWLHRSNFVLLLNLPKQIEQFGPLHSYWDEQWEQYNKNIKSDIQNMYTLDSYMQRCIWVQLWDGSYHWSNWMMTNTHLNPKSSCVSRGHEMMLSKCCNTEALWVDIIMPHILDTWCLHTDTECHIWPFCSENAIWSWQGHTIRNVLLLIANE